MARIQPIIPWSWTIYETYQTCPRLCYETRIAKNFKDDPNSQHLLWANHVHKTLELRIRDAVPLPENVPYESYAAKLAAAPGVHYVEEEVGITDPFATNGPQRTGYWDSNCWHRGKDDFTAVHGERALVMDHKTGKPKPNSQQLVIAAIRTFTCHAQVTHVKTGFAWLGHNKYTVAEYTRDQLPAMYAQFEKGVNDMLWSEKNNVWPAKPSGLCKKSRKPGSTWQGCIVATCPHSEFYRG